MIYNNKFKLKHVNLIEYVKFKIFTNISYNYIISHRVYRHYHNIASVIAQRNYAYQYVSTVN